MVELAGWSGVLSGPRGDDVNVDLEVLAYRTYWGRNREGGVEGELGNTGLWSRWLCARWCDWMCLLEIVTVTVTVTGDSCGSYVNHGKGEGRRQDARMRWHR